MTMFLARRWMAVASFCTLFFIGVSSSQGTKYALRSDLEIIAVNLRDGRFLWTTEGKSLNSAHLEIYREGLVVYPREKLRGLPETKPAPFFIDPQTGGEIPSFEMNPDRLAAQSGPVGYEESVEFSDELPALVLESGWTLGTFELGFVANRLEPHQLVFGDSKKRRGIWIIQTEHFPDHIRAWKDMVFFDTLSDFENHTLLVAYRIEENKPAWIIDLNALTLKEYPVLVPFGFQVVDDTIFLGAGHYVFAFEPKDGKLLWYRNIAQDLDLLPLFEGSYSEFFWQPTFSKEGNILIITLGSLVIAFDISLQEYLWLLDSDTLPTSPFPVVHGSKVHLLSGPDRCLTKIKHAELDPQ